MAEFELDRIRANNNAARARAVARGAHMGPHVPFGYRKQADGTLAPDPSLVPHLQEAYRLRGEGASWADIVDHLRGEGVRTGGGNEFWDPSSIHAVLSNRVYRGEVRSGEYVNPDAHAPVVDEVTWQLAQRPPVRSYARARGQSTLNGILRCAGCRYAMSPETRKRRDGTRQRYYICGKVHTPGPCLAPTSVIAEKIEPYVEQAFFRLLDRPPADLRFKRSEALRRRRELRIAELALDAYRDDERILDILGSDAYVAGLQLRVCRVDDARRAAAFAEAAAESSPLPPADELRRTWPQLTGRGAAQLPLTSHRLRLRTTGPRAARRARPRVCPRRRPRRAPSHRWGLQEDEAI